MKVKQCPSVYMDVRYRYLLITLSRIWVCWDTRWGISDPPCVGTRAAASSLSWYEVPPKAHFGFNGYECLISLWNSYTEQTQLLVEPTETDSCVPIHAQAAGLARSPSPLAAGPLPLPFTSPTDKMGASYLVGRMLTLKETQAISQFLCWDYCGTFFSFLIFWLPEVHQRTCTPGTAGLFSVLRKCP